MSNPISNLVDTMCVFASSFIIFTVFFSIFCKQVTSRRGNNVATIYPGHLRDFFSLSFFSTFSLTRLNRRALESLYNRYNYCSQLIYPLRATSFSNNYNSNNINNNNGYIYINYWLRLVVVTTDAAFKFIKMSLEEEEKLLKEKKLHTLDQGRDNKKKNKDILLILGYNADIYYIISSIDDK